MLLDQKDNITVQISISSTRERLDQSHILSTHYKFGNIMQTPLSTLQSGVCTHNIPYMHATVAVMSSVSNDFAVKDHNINKVNDFH